MATRTTISLAEFLELPDHELDGTHYELDEGQLIALSPDNRQHGFLMTRIAVYLDRIVDPKRFTVVCGDVGYILDRRDNRATVRGADVSVEAVPEDSQDVAKGFQENAPFVAIEILSPSNTRLDIQRKTAQYLAAGGHEVWLIYPDNGETHVFRVGQPNAEVYARGESFRSSLSVQVDTSKFFSR